MPEKLTEQVKDFGEGPQFECLLSLSQRDDCRKPSSMFNSLDGLLIPQLVHAEDALFIREFMLVALTSALGIYANFHFSWVSSLLFAAAFILNGPAIAVFLHANSHRKIFKPGLGWLNSLPVWILSPWFGDPPFLFAVEHVVNHHALDNGPLDISCTLGYQRDSFWSFGRYLFNFFFWTGGIFGLARMFLTGHGAPLWRNRFFCGQALFWGLVLLRLWQDWLPTVVVLLGAFVILQSINRANNWTEHAFINPELPLDPLGNSYTIINSPANGGIGGNEGYHGTHHVTAGIANHLWPKYFRDNIEKYCQADHLVFQQISTTELFFLLMRKDYRTMANHYVNLPGRQRTEDEVIEMLKQRVRCFEPIPAP